MSHNVKLDGIKFNDLSILEKAVRELVGEGHNLELVTGDGATIRGWAGQMAKVDAAIKCPNERYDIGFKREADGSYVPFFEHGFRAKGLASDNVAQGVTDKVCSLYSPEAQVGRLSQRYSVLMAERNAANNGMMTRRIVDAVKGQIHLEINHRS